MPEAALFLRSAYRAFNARDIEAAIELMHPEVDWPNAWEGGRVMGRAAVRDYWTRQFAAVSTKVELEGFTEEADALQPRWSPLCLMREWPGVLRR